MTCLDWKVCHSFYFVVFYRQTCVKFEQHLFHLPLSHSEYHSLTPPPTLILPLPPSHCMREHWCVWVGVCKWMWVCGWAQSTLADSNFFYLPRLQRQSSPLLLSTCTPTPTHAHHIASARTHTHTHAHSHSILLCCYRVFALSSAGHRPRSRSSITLLQRRRKSPTAKHSLQRLS